MSHKRSLRTMALSGNRPKAIIMGGSLGGLNAALYLRAAGFDVTVFERSITPLAGQGAGIVLNPYTVRYFTDTQTLAVAAFSIQSHHLRYLDSAGDIIADLPSPYRFASYNSIYAGLLGELGADNFHLNQRVTGFDQRKECVRVHTAQGMQIDCDLLVCADGIGSDARRWLLGNVQADYAGYLAWRGIIHEGDVSEDIFTLLQDCILYHIQPNGHFLTYPIPVVDSTINNRKRYVNWLWYRNVPEGEQLDALMTDSVGRRRGLSVAAGQVNASAVGEMKTAARALPQMLGTLIAQTEHPFIQAVFDYEIPQMAFGRICIMGDAAFSARPHTAAGTAKAAENARQLGLALHECDNDVPTALKLWETRQLKLGQQLVQRNREAGTKLQNGTWPIGAALPFGLYQEGDSEMT